MNRVECRRLEERIEALLDGELADAEQAALVRHIGSCEKCAAVRAGAKRLHAALAAEKRPEPLRPVWAAVGDRFDRAIGPRASTAFRLAATFAAAAGIILGLFIGSLTGPSAAGNEGTWSDIGSTLGAESGTSLDEIYLSGFDGESS